MDINWERSYPYYNLTKEKLDKVFPKWKNTHALNLKLIKIGCRNSNYELITEHEKYLIRITSDDSSLIKNEINLNQYLTKLTNCPKLLDYQFINNRYFLIYEFIEGTNFSQYLNNNRISKKNIIYIAGSLAKIHSVKLPKNVIIEELELPPFETWYDYFLSNQITAETLGNKRVSLINKFIQDNPELLTQISNDSNFIHSDFRPANMIITPSQQIFILDWEYCGIGHSLADVGQLFRYQEYFSYSDREQFARTYNNLASRKLPENWYLLSRLRDLINPLQLLGSVEIKLHMQADLLTVIDSILIDLKT